MIIRHRPEIQAIVEEPEPFREWLSAQRGTVGLPDSIVNNPISRFLRDRTKGFRCESGIEVLVMPWPREEAYVPNPYRTAFAFAIGGDIWPLPWWAHQFLLRASADRAPAVGIRSLDAQAALAWAETTDTPQDYREWRARVLDAEGVAAVTYERGYWLQVRTNRLNAILTEMGQPTVSPATVAAWDDGIPMTQAQATACSTLYLARIPTAETVA